MTDFKRAADYMAGIVKTVEQKDKDYGSSWRRRGGPGAFMVMARKWDRIENLVKQDSWDIFKCISIDRGQVTDDIDDLIGYLMLIREHCMPTTTPNYAMTQADGKTLLQYEKDNPAYLHDADFLCEGGYGDGRNLYTHRATRRKVIANDLQDAARVWAALTAQAPSSEGA